MHSTIDFNPEFIDRFEQFLYLKTSEIDKFGQRIKKEFKERKKRKIFVVNVYIFSIIKL